MTKLIAKTAINNYSEQEAKCEDGKFYAWNKRTGQWVRVAKKYIHEVVA